MPAFGQKTTGQISKSGILCAVLTCLTMLLLVPGTVRAQGSCAPISAPEAFLEFNRLDPMLDRYRSIRWLNSRAGGDSRYLVTGLTEYEVNASFDMRFEPREVSPGRYCLDPVLVNPKVDVVKHLVYIPAELERGTCEYDVVYAHEGEHVKINQGMEDDIRVALDDLVNDIVGKVEAMFPMPADNVPGAMRRLHSEYGRDFKRRLNDIRRRSREQHRKIDTPQEYERLSKACGPNSAFQTDLQDALR